jgi:hypothetical protein
MQTKWIGAAAALLVFAGGYASAKTLHFATLLKGADEVPANTTKGSGKVTASLDTTTKNFTYQVTYKGLTGAATMAHFHGPAAAGANAPPIVAVPAGALASPMKGAQVLTDAQIADLEAGKWYFNIHTAANPGGEVRGQVAAK